MLSISTLNSQISSTKSTMILLLLSIFLPIIIIYLLHKTRKTTKSNFPPGPPQLPLIGNLHQLATAGDLHFYLWRLSKQCNSPIIHMKLGSRSLIAVSSPVLAKEVMQDLSFFERPKSIAMKKLTYDYSDMIFAPYNEFWREMRKFTSLHLFSSKKVQSFRPIREDEISIMIGKISEFASSHQVVNLSEIATAVSSSTISRIAYGKKYADHGYEIRRFKHLRDELAAIALVFFVSDYFPALGWVDKLVGSTKRLDALFNALDSFYDELIEEHLDPTRAKKEEDEEDIIDILLKLKQDKSFPIDLNWNNIKGILMDIFTAGAGTSSIATIWAMTALIKAPNIMKKVQAEIRNSVGDKGKVDEDDLPKLPYLKAVIMESIRLYPSVPLLIPSATTKTCFLNGYEIPPKAFVYVNAWAIARDPEYWENAEEFIPERFLNSNIDAKGTYFEFTPFGAGRRMCPGMTMGQVNVETMVANLLYSFDWELPMGIRAEDIDTDPTLGLAVGKKTDLLLVPKKYTA